MEINTLVFLFKDWMSLYTTVYLKEIGKRFFLIKEIDNLYFKNQLQDIPLSPHLLRSYHLIDLLINLKFYIKLMGHTCFHCNGLILPTLLS